MALPTDSSENVGAAAAAAASEPLFSARGPPGPGARDRCVTGGVRHASAAAQDQATYAAYVDPARSEGWWDGSWWRGRHWSRNQWRADQWQDQRGRWSGDEWSVAPSVAVSGSSWRWVGETPADTLRRRSLCHGTCCTQGHDPMQHPQGDRGSPFRGASGPLLARVSRSSHPVFPL